MSIQSIQSIKNTESHWQQQSYDALLAEIDALKKVLHRKLPEAQPGLRGGDPDLKPMGHAFRNSFVNSLQGPGRAFNETSRPQVKAKSIMLDNLCELFGLSDFDRQLIVLCVGMELDAELPALCMALTQQAYPSMALALTCLHGHCSAMAPEAPLVYFQLIQQVQDNNNFIRRKLAISEWALYYLSGNPIQDPSLSTLLHPVPLDEPLLPTQTRSAQQLSESLLYSGGNPTESPVVVQLIASAVEDTRQVAAIAAKNEARQLTEFSLYQLPLRADEQKGLLRILEREIISRQQRVLIDCQRLVAGGDAPTDTHRLKNWLDCFIRDLPQGFILYASAQIDLPQTKIHYQHLPALPREDQLALWQHCLPARGNKEMNETLSALASHYNLSGRQVRTIARSASMKHKGDTDNISTGELQESLWQFSREQSQQNLQGLARVISPGKLTWEDLVLADKEKNSLQSLVSQCKQRQQVYHQWGFGKQGSYGLGICALFAGGSGTGKTMAARIIASMLKLDLYHVDLSSVVDKYIGETEKKLDKLFQAAENSGAVLLFDEADALFGKRTNVQDAKDRYANMGVSFLLQRMERYSGLSILTTNLRGAMDTAFTRRLRFIVQFPFPCDRDRQKIWQCMIPADAPTENIDYEKLGRLVLAGGAIRNITLQAAFMAAEMRQPITMQCLYQAVRQEYIKAEKTLDVKLVSDW